MSSTEHILREDLELLALGALPEQEAAAAGAHVVSCPECAARLAEARGSAALLAFAAPQDHPAGTVKAELMSRIRASRESERHYAWPSKIEGTRDAKVATKRRRSWWTWLLAPAAVSLAAVSVALYWQNHKMSIELEQQKQAADAVIQNRQEIEKFVSVLAAPDTMTVRLQGMGDAAKSSGMVKFNSKAGMVLYQADLPPLPPDKSYQMWLVPAKGTPIDAGLIGPGGNAWGSMWTGEVPANTEPKAFAVTVEPVGGMPQPTGPKVLVGTT